MRYFNRILLLSSLLLLGACGGILSPVGDIAAQQKNLIITTFVLMLIVIIPVIVLSIYLSVKYRESNAKNNDYQPEWAHNTKLELVWWGIPIIIITILSIITWRTSHSLDPYKPIDHHKEPLTVQVISLNWKWLFIYPEQEIATINYMQIPTDRPINLELTSDAPMNSFWIPQVAGQIYTMTGMPTKLSIIVSEPGEYQGLSANYSGEGFEGMKFVVKASSDEDFSKWVSGVKASNKILDKATYNSLVVDSFNNPVVYYASVIGDIFQDSVMKYMDHSTMKDMDNHMHSSMGVPSGKAVNDSDHHHMNH